MKTALLFALLWAQTEGEPAPPPVITKAPKLLEFVEAPYPEAAKNEGREGTVGLSVDVDATGAVVAVEIIESAGEDFDRAALEAVRQFRFEPAEAEGVGPIPVRIRYRYKFVLTERRVTTSATTAASSSTTAEAAPDRPLGPINFRGRVLEAGSRAPVAFAEVEVLTASTSTTGQPIWTSTSTETDARGRFALRGLAPGEHRVTVRAAYFEDLENRETVRAGEELEVLYFVERTERSPYEVVVRAKLPRKEVARRTLTLEEIQRIPGTQGDAIRVIQNLPGVARTPFGLGLLVVRGAPPQSTGVFIDGHRVPILFHFGGVGGVTSVVNSRILDQINFYPGGFGPEYGRLSAGAVELVTKEPKTDRVHGEAQIDFLTLVPINASIFLEGPVTGREEDGSFVFSLRRSSIDGVLSLATELFDSSVALAPRYYDYQVRYDRPLGSKEHRLSLFAYGSDDELVLVGADFGPNAGGPSGTTSRTYFHRFNPRYTYRGDDGAKLSISPILGLDFTDTRTSGSGNNFMLRLQTLLFGGRIDGELEIFDWLSIKAGADVLALRFESESELPAFGSVKDFPSPISTDLPTRRDAVQVPTLGASAYLELAVRWGRLSLWPGVRIDSYDFQADPQANIDPRLVSGRSRIGVDPRLTARYALTDDFSLKGQAGVFREPPLPAQFFLNADLPLIRARQLAFGFEWDLIENLLLDVQGFYRLADLMPRGTSDVEVVDGRLRAVGFRPRTEQRSYGLELLLKLEKRWGLFGWVAYTLSRSELRESNSDDDWDAATFFDQTHNLNVIGVYELGLNWDLGVRFRLVSGGGVRNTAERWYDADRDGYSRTLGDLQRAPAFHQLDVYIQKRWVFDSWYLEGYLDIQNLYNQRNTELYIEPFDFRASQELPGLPFFPSLGFRGVF